MKYRWSVLPAQPLLAARLAATLKLPPLLAQCLLNRQVAEPEAARAYLQPRLKDLADPFRLPDMSAAVERLFLARSRGEPVAIFGDYDVDGVTSTALLHEVLRGLGWEVGCYLPHRLDEGYGLSQAAVEKCLQTFPAKVLVAVDCGSTANSTVAWLQHSGVDVIVVDHHQVSSPRPPALALVNPRGVSKSEEGLADFTELCSVGLAFKLAHALVMQGRRSGMPEALVCDVRRLLDLVGMGTIADLVPLVRENRILVSAGLARLARTGRPGLVALMRVAQASAAVGAYEVGFQLAPRLNAAGRLETAEEALKLLQTADAIEAERLAARLDGRNRERQRIEREIFEQALEVVQARFNPEADFVIVEGQESWHIGVVGIVAARVLQQFYRPTIIAGGDGEAWRGSGRSIPGFDLAGALHRCGDLLIRHGGHAMAAGLTIRPDRVDSFRDRLNAVARQALSADCLQPALQLDAEVGLSEMTLETLAQLDRLKPTGQGNAPIQFLARALAHQRPLQRVGADKQHVKLWVTDGRTMQEAVWWGAGGQSLPVGRFDLAFTPQVNEYGGHRGVQLKVLDWRAATPQP